MLLFIFFFFCILLCEDFNQMIVVTHAGGVGVCMRKKGHYHNDTDLFYTAVLSSINTFAHLSELVFFTLQYLAQ